MLRRSVRDRGEFRLSFVDGRYPFVPFEVWVAGPSVVGSMISLFLDGGMVSADFTYYVVDPKGEEYRVSQFDNRYDADYWLQRVEDAVQDDGAAGLASLCHVRSRFAKRYGRDAGPSQPSSP